MPITLPHTFVNGTIADATQVNANMNALANGAVSTTGNTTITGVLTASGGFQAGSPVAATIGPDGRAWLNNVEVYGTLGINTPAGVRDASIDGNTGTGYFNGVQSWGDLQVFGTATDRTFGFNAATGEMSLTRVGAVGTPWQIGMKNTGPGGNAALPWTLSIGRQGIDVLNIFQDATHQGIYLVGELDVDGAGWIGGNLTVDGTFTNPSDRRLKRNVEVWDRGLDEIQRLEPIKFNPISNATRTRYGLMADDVESVIPELVSLSGPENHKMLDVGSLTFVLINAVKELAAEVATLRRASERRV